MKRWIGSAATVVLLAAALGAPRTALAQSGKASAEVLFSEGRRLMGEGKTEEACPKFADSQKLDPSSGTLLNLANCYEKLGRNASAWATYQEAASLAASNQRSDHLGVAQKRAAALLPVLAKVTVMVPRPVEGLEVKRDGVPLARSEWGLAVPVDPGAHTYVVEAPGHKPSSVPLIVPPTAEGAAPPSLTVVIPELVMLPPSPKEPPPVVVAPVAPVVPVAPAGPPPSTWRPQRSWALIAGGLGVVGFGFAGGFAALAKSTYNDSLAFCPHDPNRCSSAGVSQRDDARRQGDIATAALVIGASAAGLGVILWFTAPPVTMGETPKPPAQPAPRADAPANKRLAIGVSPGPGGMTVSGRW